MPQTARTAAAVTGSAQGGAALVLVEQLAQADARQVELGASRSTPHLVCTARHPAELCIHLVRLA